MFQWWFTQYFAIIYIYISLYIFFIFLRFWNDLERFVERNSFSCTKVIFLNVPSSIEYTKPTINITNEHTRSCSITGGNSYFCHRTLRSISHTRIHTRELEYRGCEGLVRRIRTGDCEVVNWNEIAVANAPI
jgi:hypothetical protein